MCTEERTAGCGMSMTRAYLGSLTLVLLGRDVGQNAQALEKKRRVSNTEDMQGLRCGVSSVR